MGDHASTLRVWAPRVRDSDNPVGVIVIPVPELAVLVWPVVALLVGVLLALLVRRREPEVPSAHVTGGVLAMGGLVALGVWRLEATPEALVLSAFVVTATPLALIDLRSGKLPNWLVALSYAVTLGALLAAALWSAHPERLVRSLLGAALFLLFYGALYVFLRGQLGGGDVKLAGVSGAVLGWHGWSAIVGGLLAIWLVGALLYLITAVVGRTRSTSGLPHGPALLLGTFAVVLVVP